jgi:hypothetical protein
MLTSDLVRVRKRKGELLISDLDERTRDRAYDLAAVLIGTVEECVGRSREALEEALTEVEVAPHDRKLADGLIKLIEDRCEFEEPVTASPEELRREVFLQATAARAQLGPLEPFDRGAVLRAVGAARGIDPALLDAGLYADLRSAHLLKALPRTTPEGLLEDYRAAQPQAVLLKAVRVTVIVNCSSPSAYRELFRKMKFLRLLFTIEPHDRGTYRIEIEGPFSMFDAVTKYGLKLALLLPALDLCTAYELTADVRWGKEREKLDFRWKGGTGTVSDISLAAPALPDDVTQLIKGFQALPTLWKVSVASSLLHLPSVGLCVPDLVFEHRSTGEKIFLEVMGYWSRDAVWRRVELIEQGLTERILFAVSERLRVSEEVLGEDVPGALYVYKGVMSPRVIAERLDALRSRGGAPLPASPPPPEPAPSSRKKGAPAATPSLFDQPEPAAPARKKK